MYEPGIENDPVDTDSGDSVPSDPSSMMLTCETMQSFFSVSAKCLVSVRSTFQRTATYPRASRALQSRFLLLHLGR